MKDPEPTPIVSSKTPTFTFQTSEQWHHSLPARQKFQLTTSNLRDLGASLKALNVLGQTPRASPSPSDSSSDSDSNHRIYKSTRKVCLREDMNMTRAISPRPSRPASLIISDPVATSMAKWAKPDTPAPWHDPAQSGSQKGDDKITVSQISSNGPSASDVSIQLNGLALSTNFTPIKRERRSSKSASVETSTASIFDSRPFRTRCGNGVGILRRSHFALPRPQSLPRPRKGSSGLSAVTPETFVLLKDFPMVGSGTGCADDPRMQSKPSSPKVQPPPDCKVGSPTKMMFDSLAAGPNSNPCPSTQHGQVAHTISPDRVRQLSTYVDHVRAQRLPPIGLQSQVMSTEVRAKVDSTQYRRMSV